MATSSHQVALHECAACHRRWQTVFAGCPYCGHNVIDQVKVDGTGHVYSWVDVHRSLESPPAPVPYTVVCIDLDAGARVFARWDSEHEPTAGAKALMVGEGDPLTFAPAP